MSDQKQQLNNAINNNETQAEDQAMQENTIETTNETPAAETTGTDNAIQPSGEEATADATSEAVAQRLAEATPEVVDAAKALIAAFVHTMNEAESSGESESAEETAEQVQQKAQPPVTVGMIFKGKVLRVEATQTVFTGPGGEVSVPDAPEGLAVGDSAYLEIVSAGPDGMVASYENAQKYCLSKDAKVRATVCIGGINLDEKTITVALDKGQVVMIPSKRAFGADKFKEEETYTFRVESSSPRKKQIVLFRTAEDQMEDAFPIGFTFGPDELTVAHVDRNRLVIDGNGFKARAYRQNISDKPINLFDSFKEGDKLPGAEVIGYNPTKKLELKVSLQAALTMRAEQRQKTIDSIKVGQVFKQARVSQVSVHGKGLRICIDEQAKIIVQVNPKETPKTITVDGKQRRIQEGDLLDVVILGKTNTDPVASFTGSVTRTAEVPLLLRAVQSKTICNAVFESFGKTVQLKDKETGEPFEKRIANVKLQLANGITVEAHPTVSINARFKPGDVLEVTVTEYDAADNRIRTRALIKRDQRQNQSRRGY